MVDGKKIDNYRGDIVNEFNPKDRKPYPEKLLEAYNHSVSTM